MKLVDDWMITQYSSRFSYRSYLVLHYFSSLQYSSDEREGLAPQLLLIHLEQESHFHIGTTNQFVKSSLQF